MPLWKSLEAPASPIMIFPCSSPIREAPAISLIKKKPRYLKVRQSAPVREVSLEAPLDCWPVLGHWLYLAWAHSSQQDLLWRRSAAEPLVPESAVLPEPWSAWASPSTKPSVMREK